MAIITFYGAAQEVTGSCHMVESSSFGRVLLDCGMHQGGHNVERMQKEVFEFNPKKIDIQISKLLAEELVILKGKKYLLP